MTLTADRATRARETTGGKGQWALGETEPLNANERFKREDDALNVRARTFRASSSRLNRSLGFSGSVSPRAHWPWPPEVPRARVARSAVAVITKSLP